MKHLKTFNTFNETILHRKNSADLKKYFITYGVGGGLNYIQKDIIDARSENEAGRIAWSNSCEVYDGYVGSGGIRDISEIIEEDNVDEEEAQQIFNDERESWLDYSAEEYDPAKHKLED